MRILLVVLTVFVLLLPCQAQDSAPTDIDQELTAMELTTYGAAHLKEGWLSRIERLEENYFTQELDVQRKKDLPTRREAPKGAFALGLLAAVLDENLPCAVAAGS